jgi:hypothetical protein
MRVGLADSSELVDLSDDFFSRFNLELHLEGANSQKLRSLIETVFRDEQKLRQQATDAGFADYLAQLKFQLESEGYKFDGLSLVGSCGSALFPYLFESAIDKFFAELPAISTVASIREHFAKSAEYLRSGPARADDCLTNMRKALKFTLEGIARHIEKQKGRPMPSEKENEVRDYLKSVWFLNVEEHRGFSGIYGLLSTGPHAPTDEFAALFGYATGVMACRYAIKKFCDSWLRYSGFRWPVVATIEAGVVSGAVDFDPVGLV